MKLKLTPEGNVVVQNGFPVYVMDDGREVEQDVEKMISTIGRLNGEAKAHREAKEAAEAKLKGFDGIEDGAAALKALELIKNIDESKLVQAGKVEEIKAAAAKSAQEAVAAATRAAEEKMKGLTEQNATLTNQLNNHIIGGGFANSSFIKDKLAIPHDIAQKVFGDRFKVDNGKLVALDQNGNPIFSASNHGEHADFEEAIQVMVGGYQHKDSILKGSGAGGTGAKQSNGSGGANAVSRAQFDAMNQAARADFFKKGGTVAD